MIFMKNRKYTGLLASVWILAGVSLCLVVAVVVSLRMERKTRETLMLQYDRALSDMSYAVSRSEEYLLKAMASGSAQQTARMLQEAARASNYAEGSMALLPIDANISAKISNYLVQVDDLAKVWADAAISDELKSSQVKLEDELVEVSSDGKTEKGWAGFTEENYTLLKELHGYSLDLSAALSELAVRVTENDHSWKDLEEDTKELLEDPFQDYPTVQYDGRFSDHMKHLTPKGLTGYVVEQTQGENHIRKIFKDAFGETPTVRYTGETSMNGIDLLCYEVSHGDDIAYVSLTKQGGILCDLLYNKTLPEGTLSAAQLEESGSAFLKALGLKDMVLVKTEELGGANLLTFCPVMDGVYCYPDWVRVKVATGNGEVIGYDAYAYFMNHCTRESMQGTAATISQETAQAKINPKLTVEEVRTCYMDNGYGGEDYFYEFRCTGLGHTFMVYVDAVEGTEERVELVA